MCDGSPCTINGSLWTLTWEARFYLVLGALAMLGLTNDRAMIWFVLPVTVVGAILWNISAGRSEIIELLGAEWANSANITDRLCPIFPRVEERRVRKVGVRKWSGWRVT